MTITDLSEHLPEVRAELELLRRAGRYKEMAEAPLTEQEKRLTEWLPFLSTK